ncbi:MAG: hypothetical protein KJ950_05175 [Proteobacteria bacterium]|nr:hypothetical protein [Pseudomonadota bacterium]MBU1687375.1 hypothetical protein [Pseudomonadota bacterium]
MSTISHTLNKPHRITVSLGHPVQTTLLSRLKAHSEIIWGLVTFLLFMALGPFSAVAVIPAVFSLVSLQKDKPEPASVE